MTPLRLIRFLRNPYRYEQSKERVEKQAEPKLGLAWVDTNFAN
jgi:hypothetical protein